MELVANTHKFKIDSAVLAELRILVMSVEAFQKTFPIFQLNIILDANVILADIKWMAQKRKNPLARPALLELLQSETLSPIAPLFLDKEVTDKIEILAIKYNLDSQKLTQHWAEYRSYIKFCEIDCDLTTNELNRLRDKNDYSYLKLSLDKRVPIFTKDKDLEGMGAKVIDSDTVDDLITYSRAETSKVSILLGGSAIGVLSIEGTLKLAQALFNFFIRRNPIIGITAILAFGAFVSTPMGKKYINNLVLKFTGVKEDITPLLSESVISLMKEYCNANQIASEALNITQTKINSLSYSKSCH